jgi:hypothetical protein
MGLSTGRCRAVMSVEAVSDGLAGSSVQARASIVLVRSTRTWCCHVDLDDSTAHRQQ